MPVNHPVIFMNRGSKNWSMITAKTDIITRLKMDILPLEGLRMSMAGEALDAGLGPMNQAFPQGSFPLGAIHEFISNGPESAAATAGFISALVSPLMNKGGAGIWIGSSRKIFPPALNNLVLIRPESFLLICKKKKIYYGL